MGLFHPEQRPCLPFVQDHSLVLYVPQSKPRRHQYIQVVVFQTKEIIKIKQKNPSTFLGKGNLLKLKDKIIKSKIRQNCSPKHVPAMIIKVPDIPRTKSGKIVELAVTQIINGEEIYNKEVIANPQALKFYENLPQLKV